MSTHSPIGAPNGSATILVYPPRSRCPRPVLSIPKPAKTNPRPLPPAPAKLPSPYRVRDWVAAQCPMTSVAYCGRRALPGVRLIEITEHGEYRGLYACKSPWLCPVCGPKIVERRADQIQTAIDSWTAMGGDVALLTLTTRHSRSTRLDFLLDGLIKAWDRFRKAIRRMLKAVGLTHQVRAVEITHGATNGWHPHLHCVLFTRSVIPHVLVPNLQQVWAKACEAAGLRRPSLKRGFDLKGATHAAKYVSKSVWDTARVRIAVGGVGVGSGTGSSRSGYSNSSPSGVPGADAQSRTIKDLLDDTVLYRRRRDRRLVLEYARATHGRSAIHWSHGSLDALVRGPRAAQVIGQALAALGSGAPPRICASSQGPRTIATIAAHPPKPYLTVSATRIEILPNRDCISDHDLLVASSNAARIAETARRYEYRWPGSAQILVDRYVAVLRQAFRRGDRIEAAVTRWDVDRSRDAIRLRKARRQTTRTSGATA